ncbi:glycosyltransferase family 4 protein [Palleronia sediminis]|uniref:glycosyltransferase family 4 protein n=1 Tax=Palleronia sediminis TaxID=2547833 RepID=UPI001455AD90|nr:glycosyltransferase family 4 protein [Palleronia sediminis]
MARVLFVVPRFHTNLAGAVRTLLDAGHEVAVFAGGETGIEDRRGLAPRIFGPKPDRAELRAALDAFAPEIALLRRTPGLTRAVRRGLDPRRTRTYEYALRPADASLGRLKRLRRWLRGEPATWVTPLPGTNGVENPRARFLPWPVDGDASGRVPGAVPHVLCVAKIAQPRKNHLAVIDALQATGRPFRLTLAGDTGLHASGASRDYLARVEARAAADPRIAVLPPQPFHEMPALYRAHDICVLAARDEPLGMAPLEAMAHGTIPLVARDAGAARYITGGIDGVLVDAQTPDALRAAFDGLLTATPAARVAMARAAAATARARFSGAAFLEAFARL